jgi:hypothetical protein
MTTMTTTHIWNATETTDTTITWTCTCGHLTIEYLQDNEHHTPIEKRKNDHIAEATALDERTANFSVARGRCGCPDDIPAHHRHEVILTNPVSGFGHTVVIRAIWMGGWLDTYAWQRDTVGLAFAQAFCDLIHTEIRLGIGRTRWYERVKPGQLARHAL